MVKPVTPYWVPKNLRKTVGGQHVGLVSLYCESFGGSDYCRHCSRDMCTSTGKPNICFVLERLRLQLIPDEAISAFGCALEETLLSSAPEHVFHCEKWCHRTGCSFVLKDALTKENK